MTARTAFLTGATGFIGGRLAQELAARGTHLRCLVRSRSDTADLERLGAELVPGEVTDEAALARGLDGADVAFHLAAIYDLGVVDAAALERVNVGGTRAFLAAAERARARLVYVSTTAALGPTPAGGAGDESSEFGARPYPSTYHRTKAEAHRLAREAQRRGLPLVIVCPAVVYGPGDRGPNGRFLRDLIAGRIPGLLVPSGWFSYVHVDDVADGLILAVERGRTGEVYVLSGEERAFNDFAAEVARLAGRRAPRLRFPAPLALATGAVLDLIGRLTGRRMPLSREGVAVAAGRWLHSHDKATRELGWNPRPLRAGLPETVAWLLETRD
ncbi:MAG: NAD-dependent epimerase/dehydratase family protein [Gemmatimonadetes bacterium]|nr:NAD-dependent epimerase/dehydratase family protein [Gemmatimonadota bacterium]